MPMIELYCTPGKHYAPEMDVDFFNPELPPGWRAVPVVEDVHLGYVYDPNSLLFLPVCPLHFIKGEPGLN